MRFYSTNKNTPVVSLKEAVLTGLAPDNGLYLPETIPPLSADFFSSAATLSFQQISFEIARLFTDKDLPDSTLEDMISSTITFEAPLVELAENFYCLELFHGPTLAFKDFGARFMARLMGHFVQGNDRELNILVATSGDTGSAVAHGFLNVPGITVTLLYPSGKVSNIQEMQLTTMGGNIRALEVDGTFDDCQRLVKLAFLDRDLNEKLLMSSANSINIARLIPQSFYYVQAYAQLKDKDLPTVFSIPCGNFGNLTAGLIAQKIGLPVHRFIAATNLNCVVPDYLESGSFSPRPSQPTISNAMDVGNPSNFARMLDLYGNNLEIMRKHIYGTCVNEEETRQAMAKVFQETGYILDPHGAVGCLGLERYKNSVPETANGIFFETAHPAKFGSVVEEVIGRKVEMPPRLRKYLEGTKEAVRLSSTFDEFKELLMP